MSYLKVHWRHDSEKQPVAFYCELDSERMEIRKVELFADGSLTYAYEKGASGNTLLAPLPMPTVEDLSNSPNYDPSESPARNSRTSGALPGGGEGARIWRLAKW